MDYQGYKLIDKIMLICRDMSEHEESHGYNKYKSCYQAYLVDPSNKKQLESARYWAKWTEYGPGHRDEETGKWVRDYEIEHPPVEFEFDNNGFELELQDCAGGSSQGGKLSFWNCVVTKDNNKFVIGINSDMLLDLLKNATFINGKCQSPLIFITQKGKVGLTVEGSETYQQCIKDRDLKKDLKAKAVTKFSFGDKISTATINEVYLGTLTQYYTFKTDFDRYERYSNRINYSRCVLTKLAKPIEYHLTEDNWPKFEKLSEIIAYYTDKRDYYSLINFPDKKEKCAKRAVSGKLELDCSEEDFYRSLIEKIYDYDRFTEACVNSYHCSNDPDKILHNFLSTNFFGFNTKPFELDETILSRIKALGIKYIEET